MIGGTDVKGRGGGDGVCPVHLFDPEELLSRSSRLVRQPRHRAHTTLATMTVTRTNVTATPTTPITTPAMTGVMPGDDGAVGRAARRAEGTQPHAHYTRLTQGGNLNRIT